MKVICGNSSAPAWGSLVMMMTTMTFVHIRRFLYLKMPINNRVTYTKLNTHHRPITANTTRYITKNVCTLI